MPDISVWQQSAQSIATDYGIDPAIFSGLIEQESSWNPNAHANGSSAFGFTQLTRAAAQDVGVNQYDPVQNLKGGAAYLKSLLNKFGGDYPTALAAYNQGAGGDLSKGFGYAKSVLSKAKKYLSGGISLDDVMKGLAPLGVDAVSSEIPGAGIVSSVLGIGGDSCGLNPVCYLRQWLEETDFVQRLALYILATIFIIGGITFLALGSNTGRDAVRAAMP